MSEINRCGPSLFLIAQRAPAAVAQDEDIYLTAPALPDQIETMDIYLTVDFARQMMRQLSEAIEVAEKQRVC
jgi:hypothetical protein